MLLGQLGVAVIGLLGLRLITQLADRAVFGEATLLLGAIGLGRNVFVAPVTNTQQRFHPEYRSGGALGAFTDWIVRYTRLSSLLFAACGLPVFVAWRFWEGGEFRGWLLVALALCLVAENARAVPLNWLSAERLQARVAVWSVSDQFAMLGCGALGLWLGADRAWATAAYVAGQSLGSIGVALLLGRLWFRYDAREGASQLAPGELAGRVRAYGTPFIALAVVSWLMNLGDRFVLGGLDSTEAVGSYVAAYSIASRAVAMPQGVLAGFARTVLFQAEGSGDRARAQRVFVLWLAACLATGALITLALWLAGPWVCQLLLDARYRAEAPQLMLGIGAGHALFGVTQVLENRLMSLGVSRSLIVPALLGGLANIALCAALIPLWGAQGAALGKVGAFGVNCAGAWLAVRAVGGGPRRPTEGTPHGNGEDGPRAASTQ